MDYVCFGEGESTMKKLLAIVLCACMLCALFAGCGSTGAVSSDSGEKVISIGVFEPTSGQNAAGGKKEILGIEYAHSLYPTININGEEYKIELVYADNASDSTKAPSAAQLLISKNVSVVLGTYFAQAMIDGGAACTTVTFQMGETDFSTIMANIKSEGYDGIFAPVSIETAPLIINQAREAGVECQIMAGDTWDDSSIASRAGENANGVFFSCFFDQTDESNAAGAEFVKGFLEWVNADPARLENNGGKDNGGDKNISSVTPCGYDAYMAAYKAIEKAQSTKGEDIRNALVDLEVPGLVTGDLKFDENGDAIKNYVAIKTFQDGEIIFSDAYTG